MPRGVFHFLWQTLKQGQEFFGFVKNLSADGSHYWVFAHVTPDVNSQGELQGYFSVRRKPPRAAIETIEPIYREMLELEQRVGPAQACDASEQLLQDKLAAMGVSYEQLVLSLYNDNSAVR